MIEDVPLLRERRNFSRRRLEEVKSKTADIGELGRLADLCIYVTGSYGRLEASEHSDLESWDSNSSISLR